VSEPECGEECQEALARLERYLDGELPGTTLGQIKQHLTACYPCTDRLSFEEQLRSIVARECVETPPASLVARIRASLAAGDLPG
jgi:mycothiol system anti-sigma-R factor